MLTFFLQGAGFGFTAGSIPGPLTSYIITTTLTGGWRRALPLVLVPITGDLPIILAVVFVLGQVSPAFIRVIQFAGGCFILYLAWGIWRQFRAGAGFAIAADAAPPPSRTFVQGLAVSLLGPGPYIFWFTVNGPILIRALNESLAAAAGFLVGFYGVFMLGLAAYIAVFERARTLDPRIVRALYVVVLVIMVGFGLQFIVQALGFMGDTL